MAKAIKAKKPTKKNKFNNALCDNDMTFEECELAILRNAVDENEDAQKILKIENNINGVELDKIFAILEKFLIQKKLVLYGGFAINATLPKYAQFYNKKHDIPDYDCYSPRPMEDAIELADIFYAKGYEEVEAKAGVHFGTYKVYVNFIAIADITLLERSIFKNIQDEAVKINGLYYCPINFLRRNMYWELSQPLGDITRWEKVLKRLNILNEHYPLTVDYNCGEVDFQRKMETDTEMGEKIYNIVREAFIFMGAVFFGGYACSLYSQHMPVESRKIIEKIPDFDVLFDDIEKGARIIREKLNEGGFMDVTLVKHAEIGEVIPAHYEIRVGKEIIAFIYQPIACHSYNTITVKGEKINVATIETMLLFHFSFYYSNQPYYYRDRILCMAKILFDVEQQNRLEQRGLLKRFTNSCMGEQNTIDNIRKRKTEKFKELVSKRGTREYMLWFLKYNPALDKKQGHRKRRWAKTNKPHRGVRGEKHRRTKKWSNSKKEGDGKSANVFGWK
jgi:hypothetical protein